MPYDDFPDIPIEYLDLSNRSKNFLKYADIRTLNSLKKFCEIKDSKSTFCEPLKNIQGLGEKSVLEINSLINSFDYEIFFEEHPELLVLLQNNKIPDKLSSVHIDRLDLSARSYNVLQKNGITNLGQLSLLTLEELKNLKNMGKKSILEIKNITNKFHIKLNRNNKEDFNINNISIGIDETLKKKKFNRVKEALLKRIFQSKTLDEVGQTVGVTRERIRQIEKNFFESLDKLIGKSYKKEISDFFINNSGINGCLELDRVGPSYSNLSKYLYTAPDPTVFLDKFFVKKKILKWQKKDNELFFYNYAADSLDEIVGSNEILEFISKHPSDNLEKIIANFCLIINREENTQYILKKVKEKLAIGTSKPIIYAIQQLKKNYVYISLKQVKKFLKENIDKDFLSHNDRSLNNLFTSHWTEETSSKIKELNLYMTKGFGNYFFLDKLGIDSNDQEEIVNFVLKLLEKNPNKNFNSSEFYNHVKETGKISTNTLDKVDKYVIDAILLNVQEDHNSLNYLGRSIWSGNSNALKQKRIEIYPTVLKILKDNNAPMKLIDIKKELKKVRGGGKNIQFHTTLSTPKLMQVSSGLWGLRDRDINVSKEQELKILKFMQDEFSNGNKILDFNDIKKIKESIDIDHDVSIYQISKMLLAHIPVGRRRTPNKLIFLFKVQSRNPLNFCFYSPEISDEKAQEYIDSNIILANMESITD